EDYRYICDEVLDKTTNTCTVGRIIRVDANYLYQCTNNQVIERRSCEETLTVVNNGYGCDFTKGVLQAGQEVITLTCTGNMLTIRLNTNGNTTTVPVTYGTWTGTGTWNG